VADKALVIRNDLADTSLQRLMAAFDAFVDRWEKHLNELGQYVEKMKQQRNI